MAERSRGEDAIDRPVSVAETSSHRRPRKKLCQTPPVAPAARPYGCRATLIEPVPHRSVLRRKYMVEFVSARVEGLWGLTAVAKVEDALRQRRCRCTVRPHAQCVEESNQRKLEHLLVPLCVIHLA